MKSKLAKYRFIVTPLCIFTAGLFTMVSALEPLQSVHQLTEYGAFTPDASDASTVAQNNATINRAVSAVGEAGGGIIALPAGTFYIGPDPDRDDVALRINHDNITIIGAGMYKTKLVTNGRHNGSRRGHGIIIVGTNSPDSPRKNITLRDFELDGQAGWTGNYDWTSGDPNGWDISHKGIVPSWDRCVDNVLLENLYVHRYRGEILYVGGLSLGKLVVRNVRAENTNGSTFNLYAADLLVENCTFGGPSRFWMELTARSNGINYPVNRAIIRNNTFTNAKLADGAAIVMCQGNFRTYAFTFEGNTISDAPHGFGFSGGVAGPVIIRNNTISNISGRVFEATTSAGWVNSQNNANITVENNTVTNCGYFYCGWGPMENVLFKGNHFSDGVTSVIYAGGPYKNFVFEENVFKNCRTPELGWELAGERPLFRNNTYINVDRREGHGTFSISSANPHITPMFEDVRVLASSANIVARLATAGYPDGQIIEVSGGSKSNPVLFAAGQTSYSVTQDRQLTGNESLYFKFNASTNTWVEIEKPNQTAISHSISGRRTPRPEKVQQLRVFDMRGCVAASICGLHTTILLDSVGRKQIVVGVYVKRPLRNTP